MGGLEAGIFDVTPPFRADPPNGAPKVATAFDTDFEGGAFE